MPGNRCAGHLLKRLAKTQDADTEHYQSKGSQKGDIRPQQIHSDAFEINTAKDHQDVAQGIEEAELLEKGACC